MTALLLAFFVFLAWSLIGLAMLALVRAKTAELWVALSAPVLGTVPTVMLLFVLSHAGFAMNDAALPATATLLALSAVILIRRRPRIPRAVGPVLAVCIVDLLLVGRPMFHFGFDWISNANDDMANYVLSASQLLRHGLLAPFDAVGLSRDRDYATAMQSLHNIGARPGADITLAAFAKVTGRAPYAVFMPLILAFNLCTISGTAALASRASRRWWTAVVAAALLAASPLFAFGVLQQLMPQVWGLGLAAVLFVWLMRADVHRAPGPRVQDLVIISALTVALIVVYVELLSTLVVAYGLFVALLVVRRRIALRALVRLWGIALAVALVLLNSYFLTELYFVRLQLRAGTMAAPDFAYTLVPPALPSIVGLQLQAAGSAAPHLAISIAVAAIILAGVIVAALVTAPRNAAVSLALIGDLLIGVALGWNENDFGLFKLYMFVQPFLAATIAVWLSTAVRRSVLALGAAFLALLVGVQLYTEDRYVNRSRNPIDLPHASASDLLPAFRRMFARVREPVIAITENPTLAKLEAASVGNQPLYFVSSNIFSRFARIWSANSGHTSKEAAQFRRLDGWTQRPLQLLAPHAQRNTLSVNSHASTLLDDNHCVLALPTGSQLVLNRRLLPEGSPNLVFPRCRNAHNLLIFATSSLGNGFYSFEGRKTVSYYQLERDYFYPGRTFVAFGRYAVFRIVNPSPTVRLEVELTKSVRQGSKLLPPAAVVGTHRVRLPLLGRGSARVFSPPLHPQMIGGGPYLVLDMGEKAVRSVATRSGLAGIYGRSQPLDPRYLTSYVRNISLVSEGQYDRLRAPSALRRFPQDLANPDLEYSGVYEDGWVAEDSYVILAGGAAADLNIGAIALPRNRGQQLEVRVNGRVVRSRMVATGSLAWQIPVAASASRRRVELRWAGTVPLKPPDTRRAAAQLKYVRLVPAAAVPTSLKQFPRDLANPGLDYAGIYRDGWLERDSYAVLAGGSATDLIIRTEVPPRKGQHLDVLVNGGAVASRNVKAGQFDLQVALPASRGPRRVELRWNGTVPLRPPDTRQAAALLRFLGLAPRAPR